MYRIVKDAASGYYLVQRKYLKYIWVTEKYDSISAKSGHSLSFPYEFLTQKEAEQWIKNKGASFASEKTKATIQLTL